MQAQPVASLVEPPTVECVYCDGLGRIEVVGNTVRFFLFTWERGIGRLALQSRERIEIILPFEAVGPAVKMTLAAMCGHVINGSPPN